MGTKPLRGRNSSVPDPTPSPNPSPLVSPSPFELPASEWKPILVEAFREAGRDRLGLAAAGSAFYAFLAIVPLLLSAVLIYGLVADTNTVAEHVTALAKVLPPSATELIRSELESVVAGSKDKKGLGLAITLAFALFSARNAAAGIVAALGIAYDREERRSTARLMLLALALTLAGLLFGALVIGAVVGLAALRALMPEVAASAGLYQALTYIVLLIAGTAVAGALYRFGPNEAEARWRWITPGSAFTGLGWVLLTVGFGFYVENFGNYDATYGSLSAVIVLLTWMFLSAYVLLLGAEINAAARRGAKPEN